MNAARTARQRRGGAGAALWPVFELLAMVGAQFVLTPLLFVRLSTVEFGIWVVAQSLLLVSPTLSLGLGPALLPAVAGAWARHDAGGGRAAVGLFLRRCATGSVLAVAAAALCVPLAAGSGWARGFDSTELATLGALAVAWVAATEFDQGFSSALKALGRFDTVAQFEVVGRALQLSLTAAIVGGGASARLPIAIAAAVIGARAVAKYVVLRRAWPRPPIDGAADPTSDRALRAAGVWVWLGLLGGIAFYAFDRWFVGAAFGAGVLAAYAVCSQLAQLPHAVASAAAQTLVPWAARCRRLLPRPAAVRTARRKVLMASVLCALPALALLAMLEPVLAHWMSPAFAAEHLTLARALTVVSLLLSLNVPSYFALFGFQSFARPTGLVLAAAAIFVGGCALLDPGLWEFVALRAAFAVLSLGFVMLFHRATRAT